MIQLDIFASAAARDAGMKRATDKADRDDPDWSKMAYELLERYLALYPGEFLCEDVRAYAALIDFPLPENARAWGQVMMTAARKGLIRSAGYRNVKNVKAHRTPATVWVKN